MFYITISTVKAGGMSAICSVMMCDPGLPVLSPSRVPVPKRGAQMETLFVSYDGNGLPSLNTAGFSRLTVKILVTGGLGFIGSSLVERAITRGDEVTLIDDSSSGRKENLACCLSSPKLKLISADVRKAGDIGRHFSGVEVAVHLAAMVSVSESIEQPALTTEVNVQGITNVVKACQQNKVKRLVFASSSAVYGHGDPPLKETAPMSALSPYAASKISGEACCRVSAAPYGVETTILRYFNVYGPRAVGGPYAGVMHRFAQGMKKGRLSIYGDGEQTRDFVHVDDVVEATFLAMEGDRLKGEVFNVGTGVETSVNDLAATFLRFSGRTLELVHEEARPGEVRHSAADITKAMKVLGYRPKVNLEQGVRNYLDWFQAKI